MKWSKKILEKAICVIVVLGITAVMTPEQVQAEEPVSEAIMGEEEISGETYADSITMEDIDHIETFSESEDTGAIPGADPEYVFDQDKYVENGKNVQVGDIEVVYEDGTPAEDGITFDLFNMTVIRSESTKYTTKDGKLSGIRMIAGKEYKIGFDVSNENWKKLEMVGAYNSKKLMRIYARYENCPPLYYDYFEGIDGKEIAVPKIVIRKVPDGESVVQPMPTSCIMALTIAHDGYYADAGCPFRIVCRDNGKGKTVISDEGKLTFTAEENRHYTIELSDNPVYRMKEKVDFIIKTDSQGISWAIYEGTDIEDENSRLTRIDLERIDGKEDPNKGKDKIEDDPDCGGGSEEIGGSSCTPQEYEFLYSTEKVTLSGMKVCKIDDKAPSDSETKDTAATPVDEPVKFVFYNSSTQTVETAVTSENGVLPDVQMRKKHNYIVYAEDSKYEMPNYYITLSSTGGKPSCLKCGQKEDGFYLYERETPADDPAEANKVRTELPVYYKKDNTAQYVPNIKVKLVSPFETVECTSDVSGNISADLIEDINYVVLVEDDEYSVESFPLTIKDKSEYGSGKYPYNHTSCNAVNGIYLCRKGTERDHDTTLVCPSKQTKVGGMNFGSGRYIALGTILNKNTVTGMSGDYDVLDVDVINLYRAELSKLAVGDFTVTRELKKGKKVKNVYYVDDNGKFQTVPFEQKDNQLIYKMSTMSMYNNVIEYAQQTSGTQVSKPQAITNTDKNTAVPATKIAKLKAGKKKFTVNIKKVKGVKGYQVRYSANKKFKSAKTKTLKVNKATIKKLKSQKKYYVKVRTYKTVKKNGKTVKKYSKWSLVKSVNVR